MKVPPLLVAILLVSSSYSWAAESDQSASLVKQGIELRRLGNDEGALPKFLEAYQLEASARNTAQLGLCEQALGRWTEAEGHLATALEHRSDPWIVRNLVILRESLEGAKANIARVEFVGGPAGASVVVNGRQEGHLPLKSAVKVNAGAVFMAVEASGFEPWSQTLNVVGAQYQRVAVQLHPKPIPTARSSDLVIPVNNSPTAPEEKRYYKQWWFYTGLGVALVGAAAAVVLLSGNDSSGDCPPGVSDCSRL